MLVPALLGLVGFLIYHKKKNAKPGAEKSGKPGKTKPGKTKPVKAKATNAKRAKKAESQNLEPASTKPQRQFSKVGGRMGSVL